MDREKRLALSADKKLKKLHAILRRMERVLIAYSGGLDSTFLLANALLILGRDNILAVTADSETYPKRERRDARKIAQKLGAPWISIKTSELEIPSFKDNPPDRCYYCKMELFSNLKGVAKKKKIDWVADGTNYDDRKDLRYGTKAAKKLGVKSPLFEARLTKSDLRTLSKDMGLPTWDKPSFACLASRFPYYKPITKKGVDIVDKAEDFLIGLGFKQVRVRHHGQIARIEVPQKDIKRLNKPDLRDKIRRKLTRLGFDYVTIDLAGYRTGSMSITAELRNKNLELRKSKSNL